MSPVLPPPGAVSEEGPLEVNPGTPPQNKAKQAHQASALWDATWEGDDVPDAFLDLS